MNSSIFKHCEAQISCRATALGTAIVVYLVALLVESQCTSLQVFCGALASVTLFLSEDLLRPRLPGCVCRVPASIDTPIRQELHSGFLSCKKKGCSSQFRAESGAGQTQQPSTDRRVQASSTGVSSCGRSPSWSANR